MPKGILNIQVGSETYPNSELFLIGPKKAIETKSNTFSYLTNIHSFTDEKKNSLFESNLVYNVLPLSDNNYLSIFLRKLTYNYRIYSSVGTYLYNASWNFIFDLHETDKSSSENNDSILEVRLVNIERLSTIHAFLAQLTTKDNEVNDISGMKDIFLKIDELIDYKEFTLIDDLIRSFIGLDFSFQFHVSLLASTLIIKDNLINRTELFENAIRVGHYLPEEERQLTLQGLE